ncbi:hypothetical protein [Vibrio rotiferianus]|uniref:hypothetical protein n=1 Tax=Vibrio rotiferianus TaxID=190895 RepID=UPI0005EFA3DB|nr:hypothetical protein [Vibrio rotiferianus]
MRINKFSVMFGMLVLAPPLVAKDSAFLEIEAVKVPVQSAVPLDKSKFVTGYGYKEKKVYRLVQKGTFRQNMQRLAKKNGFAGVRWDKAVANCEWRQDTSYFIPERVAEGANDIVAYYATTQDFYPVFSSIDNHVLLSYQGNPSNLTKCGKD